MATLLQGEPQLADLEEWLLTEQTGIFGCLLSLLVEHGPRIRGEVDLPVALLLWSHSCHLLRVLRRAIDRVNLLFRFFLNNRSVILFFDLAAFIGAIFLF